MKSAATVYLDETKSRAVGEKDPAARFLLVREGHEIAQATVDKYTGAAELIGGKKAAVHKDEKEEKPKAKH